MRRLPLFVLAALSLTPSLASADLPSTNEKPAKGTLLVEGEVPPGTVLVLANTLQGLDVVRPGQLAEVSWHHKLSKLQLVALSGQDPQKLEELRGKDREALAKLVAAGQPCAEPFLGVYRVPFAEPDETRWVWKVAFPGGKCAASLVRTEQRDASGRVLKTIPGPTADPAATPPSPTASTASASTASGSAASTASGSGSASPAANTGSCGCAVPGAPKPAGALASLLFLGALLSARRRSRQLTPRATGSSAARPRARA